MSDCPSENPNNVSADQQACHAASLKLAADTTPPATGGDVHLKTNSVSTTDEGQETLTPGQHTFSVAANGQSRPYEIYIPPNAKHPVPVVFAADGFTRAGSDPGRQMGMVNRLYEDADKNGYAVVSLIPSMEFHPLTDRGPGFSGWNFPDSVTGYFPSSAHDTEYFQAVKADIGKHIQVDASKQFCEGFSEGAQFLHHLDEKGQPGVACQKEALFDGTVTTPEPADKPGIPELIVHGDKDPLLPSNGGSPGLFASRGFLIHYFQTVEGGNLDKSAPKQLFARAVEANGGNPQDATNSQAKYFDKQTQVNPDGVRVTQYTILPPYGGHSFPGRRTGPPWESKDSQANGVPTPHSIFDGPHVAACFFGLEQGPSCNSEGTP